MKPLAARLRYGRLTFKEPQAPEDQADNIPFGITPPEGVTDAVIIAPHKVMTWREQKSTYSGHVFKEKTPEQRAKLANAYDASTLLQAARYEARQNVKEWQSGGAVSYRHASIFAEVNG